MAKLTDIQHLLLTTAAARADGNLLPPPEQLADRAPRIRAALVALLKRSLIAEIDTADSDRVWREDGDRKICLIITDAGRAEVVTDATPDIPVSGRGEPIEPVPVVGGKRPTKIDIVLRLLRRDVGATLPELVDATGWLPHKCRAALTGLRTKGHAIAKGKRGEVTCYSITVTA